MELRLSVAYKACFNPRFWKNVEDALQWIDKGEFEEWMILKEIDDWISCHLEAKKFGLTLDASSS